MPRNDKLRKKSQDVNYILQQERNRRNVGYINHDNIKVNRHLNGSKLHLNEAGTGIIAKKIINFLKFTENSPPTKIFRAQNSPATDGVCDCFLSKNNNLNLINTETPEHEFDIIKLLQKQR